MSECNTTKYKINDKVFIFRFYFKYRNDEENWFA